MGKKKPITFFLAIMLMYFIVRWMRVEFTGIPTILKYQLTDFLFIPAMCLFALIVIRIMKNDDEWIIPTHFVIIQVILISIYFEWYLPEFSQKHAFISDYKDLIAYGFGAITYLFIQKKHLT